MLSRICGTRGVDASNVIVSFAFSEVMKLIAQAIGPQVEHFVRLACAVKRYVPCDPLAGSVTILLGVC